ncbi:MAG: ZIP family metal transporter [Clostridia bacterium]|nr:ZIP family metal transporter [Clostridia bacterium]
MEHLIKTTLLGLFFGTFGTTIGGIVGVAFNKTSNKFLSCILSVASGLMTAIVCFELIPEALEISNVVTVLWGIICGITLMIFCDIAVEKKFKNMKFIDKQNNNLSKNMTKSNLLKTGIIVSIGLAIHNFPEGLAIGSGFEASITLGYSLAIAIALHDVPEGISMAVPMKNGGMRPARVIFYVVLSGITTGIGAFFGALVGGISQSIISVCLSFAAGAMLYIVSGELTPESNSLYRGKLPAIGNIAGFVLGMLSLQL